jgi:hypothetical protein
MLTHRTVAAFALAAACALTLLSTGARADVPPNTAQLALDPSFSGGSGANDQFITQPGSLDLSGTTTGGASTSLSGSTHVETGIIKGYVTSDGPASAVSRGILRDSLTITSPGVPTGTPGTLSFSISVNGSLSAPSGSSAATYQLQADLGGGAFDINASGTQYSPGLGGAFIGDPFGIYTATISFQYGFAMPLDVELTATVSAGNDFTSTGAGTSDLGHSLYWNGITNVTASGSPVGSFTVDSATGGNWTNSFVPVPEPLSISLLAVGTMGLLSRRSRRARLMFAA